MTVSSDLQKASDLPRIEDTSLNTEVLPDIRSFLRFPENMVLDLHDLATILLYERKRVEPRFKHAQLVEVVHDSKPAKCLSRAHQTHWLELTGPNKVGYFLRTITPDGGDEAEAISPDNFLHAEYNPGASGHLSARERELAFWRVKHHDSGYTLVHAMQLALDYLPASTRLRVRTSGGKDALIPVRAFGIYENTELVPNSATYICHLTPREGNPGQVGCEQHIRDGEAFPYVYMVFSNRFGPNDGKLQHRQQGTESTDFVLDLVPPMLGMRGPGGEVFALEEHGKYFNDVLQPASLYTGHEDLHMRLQDSSGTKSDAPVTLSFLVLARLLEITKDKQTYCGYCGKEEPAARCSACKKASFCEKDCQDAAWKYHKAWCKKMETGA